jgi:hypothetical protein
MILAALSFMLSLVFNIDASITVGILIFILGKAWSSTIAYVYDSVAGSVPFGDLIMQGLNYVIPQLTLLDLTEKAVHEDAWGPISAQAIGMLTVYAAIYVFAFLAVSHFLFRRRPL